MPTSEHRSRDRQEPEIKCAVAAPSRRIAFGMTRLSAKKMLRPKEAVSGCIRLEAPLIGLPEKRCGAHKIVRVLDVRRGSAAPVYCLRSPSRDSCRRFRWIGACYPPAIGGKTATLSPSLSSRPGCA